MARLILGGRLLALERERQERNTRAQQRVLARELLNPLDISDAEFQHRYRFTKESFAFLRDELLQHTNLRSSQRISLEMKLLCALFFFASGSYQRIVGVTKQLSQKSASRYIAQVVDALKNPEILRRFIAFPCTAAARNIVKEKFYRMYGIPGVVGAVDGTHIRIFSPPRAVEHQFYCRKHFHSLNVQVICDSDYKILSVNPRYGGATHDAFIWENSAANTYMQSLNDNNEHVWLLGDSGYPLRAWMMTPVLDAADGSDEEHYNVMHKKGRVVIENTFGRLKNRWRCLIKDRTLHYKPQKCAKIVTACCVLHNIAIQFGLQDPEEDPEVQEIGFRRDEIVHDHGIQRELAMGRAVRNQLIRRLRR